MTQATSLNVVISAWPTVKYRAAAQVADGTLTEPVIAKAAGVSHRQLQRWKKEPAFSALVRAITGDAAAAIKDEAVASKAGRLRILVDLHNKLLTVIEARARAGEEERAWAAGESTGLIVTKETWGKVESREAAVDTALVKQIQSLQEQIVKELNNWDLSVSVKHSGRVDHVHRTARYDALSDEELDRLEALALKVYGQDDA